MYKFNVRIVAMFSVLFNFLSISSALVEAIPAGIAWIKSITNSQKVTFPDKSVLQWHWCILVYKLLLLYHLGGGVKQPPSHKSMPVIG